MRCSRSRLASAIAVGRPLYERPADRRFDRDAPEKRQEAEMLLDGASRPSDDVSMPASPKFLLFG